MHEFEGLFLTWFCRPILVIFSEETVKKFSTEKHAMDKPNMYDVMKKVFGEGLITSNGDVWKNHRKILNAVFNTDMLKEGTTLCNKHADSLVKQLANVVNKEEKLVNHLKTCSFRIAWDSIIGLEINENKKEELMSRCLKVESKLSEITAYRTFYPWFQYDTVFNLTSFGRDSMKWYKERSRLLQEVIMLIKESMPSHETATFEKQGKKSFLQSLLEQHRKDKSFTTECIQDEISTFVSGGFETVSNTLLWCLFLLGHHRDIQEKIFNEVQTEAGEFITYDVLHYFKYLDCVIKETLRLYPAIPIYARHLKKDVLCGKFNIPKNTTIAFVTYSLHRNPKVFQEPENFNPDRFLDDNVLNRPWAYVPFSEGLRNCIGEQFAIMELKVVTAYIIRNYYVTSLNKIQNVGVKWDVALIPDRDLYFQLTPRNSSKLFLL